MTQTSTSADYMKPWVENLDSENDDEFYSEDEHDEDFDSSDRVRYES